MESEVDYSMLPEHMQYGVRDYVEHGVRPGSFLLAVLHNDLVNSFGYADGTNVARMVDWARWLYNEAPSDCWGSPEKVRAWMGNFTTQEEN